jgi:hypothetical protein
VHLEERLLHRVLGELPVAGDGAGDPVDLAPVELEQGVERRFITVRRLAGQPSLGFGVGESRHRQSTLTLT